MRKKKKTSIERNATPLFELAKPVSLGGSSEILVFFPKEQQPQELLIKQPVSLGGAVKILVFFPSEQQPKELLITQGRKQKLPGHITGRLT